ncbi:unnamed protein product [Somion occarium]|uniref:F-box domain-containing protein n=1 Tax=Somion occarium TaxID=3059160 RepID=A0ABP1E655_9APHY
MSLAELLPPELDDHILSFLASDPRSLSACANTCRSWSLASRRHLYRDIHLETPQRVLFGSGHRHQPVAWDSFPIFEGTAFFPNLTSIGLLNIYGKFSFQFDINILQRFPSVWRLSFFYCTLPRAPVLGILTWLPSLRALTLDFCKSFQGPETSPCLDVRSRLSRLSYLPSRSSDCYEGLLPILIPVSSLTMRSLALSVFNRYVSYLSELRKYMTVVNPYLTSLELYFVGFKSYDLASCYDALDHMSLKTCTNLHTLILRNPSLPIVPLLLSQIPVGSLRILQCHIDTAFTMSAARLDLQNALSTRKFDGLEQLRFVYSGDKFLAPVLYSELEPGYPEFAQRGVLRVIHDNLSYDFKEILRGRSTVDL